MEKIDGERGAQLEVPEKPRFSILKWIKKLFGDKKAEELTPEEREKAIEESIEQFAGTSIKNVIEIIRKSGHSRIPLFRNSLDEIMGIIYAKDLLTYALKGEDIDLSKIVRKSYFIPENIKIDDLLAQMRKRKLHIAIVADEYGGTSGLVTMEDIIEEIVGEIEDEYDFEAPPIMRISDNEYLVDGTLTISDLNEELDLKLPEDEIETVGGLIYDLVGSLPEKGQVLEHGGNKFIVHVIEGQRIVKVKIILGMMK
jgi:CBS domain containing-hemolysin-like protein